MVAKFLQSTSGAGARGEARGEAWWRIVANLGGDVAVGNRGQVWRRFFCKAGVLQSAGVVGGVTLRSGFAGFQHKR